jgi:hypothetical protein
MSNLTNKQIEANRERARKAQSAFNSVFQSIFVAGGRKDLAALRQACRYEIDHIREGFSIEYEYEGGSKPENASLRKVKRANVTWEPKQTLPKQLLSETYLGWIEMKKAEKGNSIATEEEPDDDTNFPQDEMTQAQIRIAHLTSEFNRGKVVINDSRRVRTVGVITSFNISNDKKVTRYSVNRLRVHDDGNSMGMSTWNEDECTVLPDRNLLNIPDSELVHILSDLYKQYFPDRKPVEEVTPENLFDMEE